MRAADTALLVIDLQNDFCPGGALAVPDGDAVVPLVNRLMARFDHVLLTQDWHPRGHRSFASSHPGRQPFDSVELAYGAQILWPDHCVQGTAGAEFHPELASARAELIIRKGVRPDIDSYSAFYENDRTTPTGLVGYLRERRLTNLYLCGLATDFCVLYSALDAARLGFAVAVLGDACRAIDRADSLAQARQALAEAGVAWQSSSEALAGTRP